MLKVYVSDRSHAAASFGTAIISNDAATDPSSIAIARTLGLCCEPGVITGVVSWPPVVFDWNAKVRGKRAS